MPPSLPSSLTPHVLVFATDDLAHLLQSNELPPLHSLLENFSPLGQVITRTTTLVPVTHPSFTLRFSELTQIESACREDEEERASRTIDWVGGRIARKAPAWVNDVESRKKGEPMKGDTKWWQELKECIDGDRAPARGEGWNHPVALILATTTLAPNPLQAVSNLHTRLVDFPAWVDTNILRYTLVIHPTNRSNLSQDETSALMNATKKQYGLHCHLLTLNMAKPPTPKQLKPLPAQVPPPSTFPASPEKAPQPAPTLNGNMNGDSPPLSVLNLSDEDTVTTSRFMREFVTQSLVPWMERSVLEWNEIYSSSRRLPSRLFSSTRRLFGTSTANTISSSMSLPSSPVSTPNMPFSNQPQALSPQRRLAEFATFLGDHKLAVPLWESIRKEGKGGSDVLPMLLAPSLTLEAHAAYALAPLTTGTALGGRDGVRIGAASQLKALIYAIRWEQGVSDVLELGGERWLVWAAGTTEETPMALLVAQAALMSLRKGSRRVAAMWYVFAANRLEKCGVKSLTMYFLRGAHDLYLLPPEKLLSLSFDDIEGKGHSNLGFTSILPTIEHSLGRLQYTTGDISGAAKFFLGLLKGSVTVQGMPPDSDRVLLEDFRLAYEHFKSTTNEPLPADLWSLPSSISQPASTRRRFAAIHSREGDPVDADEATVDALEVLEERWRSFWKGSAGSAKEPLEKSGSGEVGEYFWVDVVLKNPLNTELTLDNVTLILKEVGQAEGAPEGVEVEVIPQVVLGPKERRTIAFFVYASRVVSLEVSHISFVFLSLLPIRESLGLRGRRLNDTVAQQRSVTYASDVCMRIDVKQSGGRLKGELLVEDELPKSMGVGELRKVIVRVTNIGKTSISDVWAILGESAGSGSIWYRSPKDPGEPDGTTSPIQPCQNMLSLPDPIHIPLELLHESSTLSAGESFDLPLVMQPHTLKAFDFSVLFVFRQTTASPIFYSSHIRRTIAVEPILDVLVNVQPQVSATPLGYSVQLELENVGTAGDVNVGNVESVSAAWVWNKEGVLPAVSSQSVGVIEERQVARVFAAVRRVSSEAQPATGSNALDFLVRKMDALFQGNPVGKDRPPPVDLHLSALTDDPSESDSPELVRYFIQSTRRQRLQESLITQFPLIPPADHPYIFPLYTPSDFEVVVSWTIPSLSSAPPRRGFTIVSGLALGTSGSGAFKEVIRRAESSTGGGGGAGRNMYAETTREREALVASVKNSLWNREEDPILVHVQVADKMEHDFGSRPLSVPVIFNVRNTSTSHAVQVTLKLAPEAKPGTPIRHPLPRYIGVLTQRVVLAPSAITSIRAKLWITRAGVYAIGGWQLESRLVVETGDDELATTFTQSGDDPNNLGKVLIANGVSG